MKVFLKALQGVQSYKQHLPDAPPPLLSKPLPIRSGTWIEAGNFYSEHLEIVKLVVTKFPSDSAVSVYESQSAISHPKAAFSVALHLKQFWLASRKYEMFRNPGTIFARIYGHNEKCK
jgi:hypothetical protein